MGYLKQRKLKNGNVWYIRYQDEHGNQVERRGSTDKAIAPQKLAAAEKEAERRKSGLTVIGRVRTGHEWAR